MLKMMRNFVHSWVLKALLMLVVLSFIGFYGGSSFFKEKKKDYVAKVNGTTINREQYNEAMKNLIQQYEQVRGAALQRKMIDELHLKEKIMNDLINRILVLQEAKHLGLTVSDDELRDAIAFMPPFQVNGQFDRRAYEYMLRSRGMTPEMFEQGLREDMLWYKTTNMIRLNSGRVSDQDVLETYLYENEQINLSFIKVRAESFKNKVQANEIEIKDYYQKHQEDFRTPDLVQIQYLLFRSSDYEGRVTVSQDEIKKYYNLRKDQFKTSPGGKQKSLEEVKGQILQTLKKEKASKKASQEASDVFFTLFEKRDLAGYAREKKIPTKTTDYFKEGDSIPDIGNHPSFASSAFSLKQGEISAVVSLPPNFYILKRIGKKTSRIPALAEIKEKIVQKVIEIKSDEKARQTADELLRLVRSGQSIQEVAKEKGCPLEATGWFTRSADLIPKIGNVRDFAGALASLTEKNPVPQNTVRIGNNYFFIKLAASKPANQSQFPSIKKDLEKRLVSQKQGEAVQNWLDQLKKKSEIDINKEILDAS